jgi:hypothetical protein
MKTNPQPTAPDVNDWPEEIRIAVELNKEFDAISEAWDRTDSFETEARARFDELLKTEQLTLEPDPKRPTLLSHLHSMLLAAPEKKRVLNGLLSQMEKPLRAATVKAANQVNNALAEASRGHQEIAARAVVGNFETIKDARIVMRTSKSAKDWLNKRLLFSAASGDVPKIEAVIARAEAVYPELKKLRAELGGAIPSAVEMNA